MEAESREQRFSDELYSRMPEIERSSKRFMRGMVPRDRPLRVLDVGCGTGLNANILRDMGHTVVGVDLSPVAIEKMKQAGFEGYVADIAAGLPFQPGTFDMVYASEVIEHIADTESFLTQIALALKPGGLLMLSTPNSAFWPFRLTAAIGRTVTEVQHPGHLRFFSKRGLVNSIKAAGFTDVNAQARHIYLLIPDKIGQPLSFLLKPMGFEREYRLRTNNYLWHINRLAKRASPFWADTLIITATKAG
jgi:2-polyprenyl-3-methyl-5-hydroxy-6-metoxy-1,4-benzoquinol methylase